MKKSLPVPLIVGAVVVALVVVGGILAAPMMKAPGPDASQIHTTPDQIAQQRANPPHDDRPLPQYSPPGGGPSRPTANDSHGRN